VFGFSKKAPASWPSSRTQKVRRRRLAAAFGLFVVILSPLIALGPGASSAQAASSWYAVASTGCSPGEVGTGDITVTYYNVAPGGGGDTTWYYSGASNGHVDEPIYQYGSGTQPIVLVSSYFAPGNYSLSVTWYGGGMPATNITVPDCGPPPATFVGMASTTDGQGYWLVKSDGTVTAHGDATFQGDMSGTPLNRPIVGIAPTADGKGYWLDASDGGIFAFGDAQFHGSMGGSPLNQPMVSMAATPDGQGYWTVAADGGIFAFGDAQFHGSMGGSPLNQPVDGMAVDSATGGYWLVASDGGIFAYNAPFYGSTGNLVLNKPIVEMEAATNGSGYRFVASDGGIFCFNLPFEGSLGGNPPADPIAGMAASGTNGYWVVEQNGTVHVFGSAPVLS